MIKIRLSRQGSKHKPTYRVIVLESYLKNQTHILETLGYYDPKTTPKTFTINQERFAYWQGQGAQMATGVRKLITSEKSA